ncbi:hypothetical protein R5R35_011821 [Gryllus longicercus]|uniref:Uncharacterized protein n=1 Tax=Gryllus longicercus TaxID=2509291 RepID=A0AAN9WPS1_9ORTH
MRIPHTIPEAVLRVYEPSAEAGQLKGGEEARTVRAENFGWDTAEGEGAVVPPSLVYWCVLTIAQNFEKNPILDELPPCNRDQLLEILSTELPLELTVLKVPDGIYWQRCCEEKWDSVSETRILIGTHNFTGRSTPGSIVSELAYFQQSEISHLCHQ